MRKLKSFMVMAFVLVLASCSNNNKPEVAAEEFTKLLYTADFEGAKALCTEESKQAVDFVAAFATQKVAEMKKADIKFEITEVKLADDGKSADVKGIVKGAIDLKNGEVKDSTDTKLHLVKQNEKWLVDFKLK
jgi:hypothetical protein